MNIVQTTVAIYNVNFVNNSVQRQHRNNDSLFPSYKEFDQKSMIKISTSRQQRAIPLPAADPGFSRRGRRQHESGMCQQYYLAKICQKLYKNERYWTERGTRVPGAFLGSATEALYHFTCCKQALELS